MSFSITLPAAKYGDGLFKDLDTLAEAAIKNHPESTTSINYGVEIVKDMIRDDVFGESNDNHVTASISGHTDVSGNHGPGESLVVSVSTVAPTA